MRKAFRQCSVCICVIGLRRQLQSVFPDCLSMAATLSEEPSSLKAIAHDSFRYFKMSSYIPPWLA